MKITKPSENHEETNSTPILTNSNLIRIKKPSTDSTGKSTKRVVTLLQATNEDTTSHEENTKDAVDTKSEDVIAEDSLTDNKEEELEEAEPTANSIAEETKSVLHRLKLPKRKSKFTTLLARDNSGQIKYIFTFY